MKKLLVLMLVLGMASVANATVLSWSVDAITIPSISATVVVQLTSDDDQGYDPKSVGASGASSIASIVNIVATPNAGPDSTVQELTSYPEWWAVRATNLGSPFTVTSGAQFNVTIKGLATGTHAYSSDYYGTDDTLEITVLPEPATVALLGLGGLFLLRRRK
ncbi:MAG: PEP-CTERM sorting domain-containing protein [Planctomycetota bacterium]|jgi:hypothetical protein